MSNNISNVDIFKWHCFVILASVHRLLTKKSMRKSLVSPEMREIYYTRLSSLVSILCHRVGYSLAIDKG